MPSEDISMRSLTLVGSGLRNAICDATFADQNTGLRLTASGQGGENGIDDHLRPICSKFRECFAHRRLKGWPIELDHLACLALEAVSLQR